ncbi:hypothetical protein [Vibrio mexicanus]|uniref:hypothetical protein n=1 Tax=Vibrio mexicanus TaxID=1004326 RepID=UPI00069BBBBD|nr:hypothetical protein [Vibrio mexicanus]
MIIEGIRYNVSDVGVGTFDEKSNERVSSIPWHETIENWRDARAEYRSISPLGKYAWVASKQYRFFIDIENQTAEVNNNYMPTYLALMVDSLLVFATPWSWMFAITKPSKHGNGAH